MTMRDVISGDTIDFQVLGRADIARVCPQTPHVVISISEPGSPAVRIANSPARLGLLRLTFHDAEEPFAGGTLLSEQDARAIVAFVREHRASVQLIVCQCEGGISRSAGVAAALSQWLNGGSSPFFSHFVPNRHVYRTVLAAVESASA